MLTADELDRMRADAAATMDSTAILVAPTETQASDGQIVVSFNWNAGTTVRCGFRESTSRTQYLSDGTLVEADAVARLPYGTAVGAG